MKGSKGDQELGDFMARGISERENEIRGLLQGNFDFAWEAIVGDMRGVVLDCELSWGEGKWRQTATLHVTGKSGVSNSL